MPAPALLALGVSAASAGRSWWLGRRQAEFQREATDEELRRLRLEHDRTLGTATARAGASGVEFESASIQGFLGAMRDEFRRQEEWLRRSGYRAATMTRQAANFGLVTDLGSSLIGYGNASNWWRRPPGGTG